MRNLLFAKAKNKLGKGRQGEQEAAPFFATQVWGNMADKIYINTKSEREGERVKERWGIKASQPFGSGPKNVEIVLCCVMITTMEPKCQLLHNV